MPKKVKNKKRAWVQASAILTAVLCCSTVVAAVLAATNHVPVERTDGWQASTLTPIISGYGSSAESVTPEVLPDEEVGQKPFEPFIPDLKDDEPFVDMENAYDFSEVHDYSNATLTARYGSCSFENGAWTATSNQSIYANTSASTPFPYGTISANVMNNASDSGIVFGLSSAISSFWEGAGISYYFAFVNWEGVLYLGKTDNSLWSALAYTDIPGWTKDKTYRLTVVYRVDKIVLLLDGDPMVSYRTDVPLSGTGWGIRTGSVGAVISDLTISSSVTLE